MSESDSTSLAESFSHMARLRFRSHDRAEALDLLLRLAVAVVPGADTASVTVRSHTNFERFERTTTKRSSLDDAQYRANLGPCVEAVAKTSRSVRRTTRPGPASGGGRRPQESSRCSPPRYSYPRAYEPV